MIKNTLFSLFELRKDTMEVVALIISGIAFFIAVIAFQRTGGIKDFRWRARAVSSRTQMVRKDLQHRAEAVSSMTQTVRNDLQHRAESVSSMTQTVRDRAANILEGLDPLAP